MKIASFKSLLYLITFVVTSVGTCNAVKRNRVGKIRHNLKQLYKNIPGVNSVLLSEKIAILYALQKTYDKNKERSAIFKVSNRILYLQTQMHIFQGQKRQRLDDYLDQYQASYNGKPWNVFVAEREFIPVPDAIESNRDEQESPLTLSEFHQHLKLEETTQPLMDNTQQKRTLVLENTTSEDYEFPDQSPNLPSVSNSPRNCTNKQSKKLPSKSNDEDSWIII